MIFVLLPGLDGTGTLFEPLLPFLETSQVNIISYPTDQSLSYDQLENYVRERLPRQENFTLVAESFSGPVAWKIATSPPEHLKKVIFVATFLKNPRPVLLKLVSLLPLATLLRLPQPGALVRFLLLGKIATKKSTEKVQQALGKVSPKVLAFRLRQINALRKPKQQTLLPTIYLQAEDDRAVKIDSGLFFLETSPATRLIALPGPHLLLQTLPGECAKIILEE